LPVAVQAVPGCETACGGGLPGVLRGKQKNKDDQRMLGSAYDASGAGRHLSKSRQAGAQQKGAHTPRFGW